MTAWKTLIKKYADGKPICNCGDAYYSPCGVGIVIKDGVSIPKNDMLAYAYGCSSNQLDAKEYVAKCVLADMKA